MQIVFRTDASIEIGTGHVMRCLTLAGSLVNQGAQVRFLCRAHEGNLIELIKSKGFTVYTLPYTAGSNDLPFKLKGGPAHESWLGSDWESDAEQCREVLSGPIDWIIVDHYALDHRWESAMRNTCYKIMCIDDLADRVHNCDLLLDQSLGRTEDNYCDLVIPKTRLLLGSQYILLRPEFAQWRDFNLAHRQHPELRHILVTMGGVDRDNVTGAVLRALAQCRLALLEQITVILGPHSPWRDNIYDLAERMEVPTKIMLDVPNMAELMTSCDLAIGAGGTTTWERCSLGVPSVSIVLADNQLNLARHMLAANAAFVIDDINKLEASLVTFLERDDLSGKMKKYTDISSKMFNSTAISKIIEELEGNYG